MSLQEIADIEIPGYIYGENEASIFLDKDIQVLNITKHISTREQFIQECVDEGRTELKKVRSKNNSSYIMDKNYTSTKFQTKRRRTFAQ